MNNQDGAIELDGQSLDLSHHQGHGCVVVGATAEEAFFACTFLEENAAIQLQAEILGGAIPLSPEEARDCAEGTFNPRLFPLLWKYYERKVLLS